MLRNHLPGLAILTLLLAGCATEHHRAAAPIYATGYGAPYGTTGYGAPYGTTGYGAPGYGTSRGGTPPAATAPGGQASPYGPGASHACPTALPGATATVDDTADGVAITFTGPARQTEALRARVHGLAELHTRAQTSSGGQGAAMMQGCPCMGGAGGATPGPGAMYGRGPMMGPDGRGMMQGLAVPSDAIAVDVPNGAQLVLTPRDPADLDGLRDETRAWVEQMQSGQCPGM